MNSEVQSDRESARCRWGGRDGICKIRTVTEGEARRPLLEVAQPITTRADVFRDIRGVRVSHVSLKVPAS